MFSQATESAPAVSVSLAIKNNISAACFEGTGQNCRSRLLSGAPYAIWCYLTQNPQEPYRKLWYVRPGLSYRRVTSIGIAISHHPQETFPNQYKMFLPFHVNKVKHLTRSRNRPLAFIFTKLLYHQEAKEE